MRTLTSHPTTYIFGTVKYSSVTHLTGIQAIEFYMGILSIGSTQQCGSLYDAIREQTLQSILGGVQIGFQAALREDWSYFYKNIRTLVKLIFWNFHFVSADI